MSSSDIESGAFGWRMSYRNSGMMGTETYRLNIILLIGTCCDLARKLLFCGLVNTGMLIKRGSQKNNKI